MCRPAEWTETDSKDNALGTATHAGVANKRHVLTRVIASYSAAKTGLLQIKNGTSVILEKYIVNADEIEIPEGLRNLLANQSVSAELAASGTGGVLGKVALIGYSTGG